MLEFYEDEEAASGSGELRLQQGVPCEPERSRVSVPVPQETPSPTSQAHRFIKGMQPFSQSGIYEVLIKMTPVFCVAQIMHSLVPSHELMLELCSLLLHTGTYAH